MQQRTDGWPAVLALWLLVLAPLAGAAAPAGLTVSQAVVSERDLTLYLDARDANGAPLTGLTAADLTATLGPAVATVTSATPVAATGEGLLTVFLVDCSRSIGEAQFARIRAALAGWVAAMGPADRAALVTFGESVRVLVPPTADRRALISAVDGLARTDQRTALHEALVQGLALARTPAPDLPARRVIVTLTDGDDDAPGVRGPDEVRAAIADGAPVPIYAIGFSTLADRARREAGLAALGGFARASGGVFIDASADPDPATAYAALRQRLGEAWRVQLRCEDCVLDGNRHRLNLTLRRDGVVLPVGLDVRLLPEVAQPAKPEPPPGGADQGDSEQPPDGGAVAVAPGTPDQAPPAAPRSGLGLWVGVGGASLLLLLLAWLLRRRRRRGALPAPVAEQLAAAAPVEAAPAAAAVPKPPPVADVAPTRVAPVLRPPPTRQLRLTFTAGTRRGEVLTLGLAPAATIGRAPDCALVIADDAEVSGRHAELALLAGSKADGPVVLRDLGSTNGTRLNGIAIAGTHPLTTGDLIGIGETEFRVTL